MPLYIGVCQTGTTEVGGLTKRQDPGLIFCPHNNNPFGAETELSLGGGGSMLGRQSIAPGVATACFVE